MTSGFFHSFPIDSIVINREERQRRDLTNIEELAESISRLGLIHPIVVTRDGVLVAGERRLSAARSLGWTHISGQYVDELDTSALRAIELEENIKRVDMPWQDVCRAMQQYHELRKAENPEWNYEDTSSAIGITPSHVRQRIVVATQLDDPMVANADKYSVARNYVERKLERKKDAEIHQIGSLVTAQGKEVGITTTKGPTGSANQADDTPTILTADFTEWAPAYSGPKFNFIHCDFPYGIGADSFDQGGGSAHGVYDDSFTTYETLLDTLSANLPRLCTDSCHLLFWFSMKYYDFTLAKLSEDWNVNPFPLIWFRSDNSGILPDPQRGPRRVYETAFFGSRGDRKIVKPVANAYAAPMVRERHMSEKPEPMLRHFFTMFVDEYTTILDPTAGSASAIRAAESLGAKYSLGLELNPEFAERANIALIKARRLRSAS